MSNVKNPDMNATAAKKQYRSVESILYDQICMLSEMSKLATHTNNYDCICQLSKAMQHCKYIISYIGEGEKMIDIDLGTPTMVTTAADGRKIECYGGDHLPVKQLAATLAQIMKEHLRNEKKQELSAE